MLIRPRCGWRLLPRPRSSARRLRGFSVLNRDTGMRILGRPSGDPLAVRLVSLPPESKAICLAIASSANDIADMVAASHDDTLRTRSASKSRPHNSIVNR